MSAKVRRIIDLGNIYIKKIGISRKIPIRVLAKSSVVGSVSLRRTWGTGSRKNLMKARLQCRSIRSMSWPVKKASSQSGVVYGVHSVSIVTSKSSFLLEEPERRISKGYCRDIRPRSPLSMYTLGLRPNPRM